MGYDDGPRYGSGSRVGVLLVGLLLGAVIMTAVWVGIAGNPLSDVNEVVYRDITVASVSDEQDSICWSENPGRRDATRACAILALDPAIAPPQEGDHVTIGLTILEPERGEQTTQVVYIAPAPGPPADSATEPPTDTEPTELVS